MKKSIFIQISSYHDYELPKTIDNFINNSSGKNDIFFGVHYVFENEDNIKIQNYNNIRFIASKAPDNLSPGLGRYLAHSLYNNEDYYMVIDSHSRVCKDWDELLISDISYYKELGHNKPVLTSYPATYFYDVNGNEILKKYMSVAEPPTHWIENYPQWKCVISKHFYAWYQEITGRGQIF